MAEKKPIKLADTMAGRIEQLADERHAVELGGGEDRLQKQRDRGKQTARERIDNLVDAYSFDEVGAFRKHRTTLFGMDKAEVPADGVVTGRATIHGRPVHIASQDFTVMGGSAGETQSTKVVETMEQSLLTGTPFLFFYDSGGARIQEGIDSLSGYGKMFYANVKLSGVVPQIAIIAGPCAGGASYSPALTDFIIMTKKAHMFITGPGVIKSVTGEEVTADDLGGADAHMSTSGNIHFVAEDDDAAVLIAQKLLSFLPQNNTEDAQISNPNDDVSPQPELRDIVPLDGKKGYDVRDVISKIVDWGDYLEVKAGWATNIVTAFARVNGRTVGIVANQPLALAGALDSAAAEKAARFVRTCDAFNVPVLTLVDVPGFLPGTDQEWNGIIRRGAKLIYAYAEATVPLVTVITRKAYGGAYDVMGSKHLGADINLAWPTAQIAVMGAQGAVNILYRKQLAAAEAEGRDLDEARQEFITAYEDALANPYVAAERGYIDTVITPSNTRMNVSKALRALRTKRERLPPKKHGNIPL